MRFANSPLLWILALFAAIGTVMALRAFVGYRAVKADARSDHAYRQREGMRGGEVELEDYQDAFVRVHGPRAQAHAALGFFSVIVLTFPILRLADLIMKGVWEASGRDRTWEPTFLVYQFGIMFLVLFFWAMIALVVAKSYHSGVVERVDTLLYDAESLRRDRAKDIIGLVRIVLGSTVMLAVTLWIAARISLILALGLFIFAVPLVSAWARFGKIR